MTVRLGRWWDRFRVRQKVGTVVLVLCVPLLAALIIHVTLIQQLLSVQQKHEETFQSRGQIRILHRLVADIEGAFRGYLLTQQAEFLKPMREAESRLEPTVSAAVALAGEMPGLSTGIQRVKDRLTEFLEPKRALIRLVQAGRPDVGLKYVQSGKGLALSDAVQRDLRMIEDQLDRRLESLGAEEAKLARQAFWGLLLAVAGCLALGMFCARLLTRSLTAPLTLLHTSVARLGKESEPQQTVTLPILSSDEIGDLARAYEEMAHRIHRHIRELESINAIGNEINSIGPDGLDGLLWRITNRAAEMLQVDVCVVMLRDERMECWVVEAASGDWHEKLHKTVFLWQEFPVSVRAFETRVSALGEDLHSDRRPEVRRRNRLAGSMLSIPLLSRGEPFGVLAFLRDRMVPLSTWNVRLAESFAEEAAIAISNARLYEAAQQRSKGLESRLKQLEHLAETLAHDMKAPGERMQGLAALLLARYEEKLDQEAARLLALIQENGQILTERIETILDAARVGARHEAVEAVDPALVISDVLTSRAGELEERKVRVHVGRALPMVACHRAYLRQVFDNLVSNAVKFSGDRPDPEIRVEARVKEDRVHFSVMDNGCGIPPEQRARVFEPFVQLNSSSVKGTGIGLTIVKRIVELYGGEVWVEPEGPPGCAVTFTLPVLGDMSAARQISSETDLASMPGGRGQYG